MVFAQVLEELVKKKRIKQKDLATRAGLTPGYVNHLIKGTRTAPSEDAVSSLADALELDLTDRSRLFEAAGFPAKRVPVDFTRSAVKVNQKVDQEETLIARADWGEIPNVQMFYGREQELDLLEKWIVQDNCQMVALIGIGGVGKTMLAAKAVGKIQQQFEYTFWRSLQNTPPIENILKDCIRFLSDQHASDIADDLDDQIAHIIGYLREHRCLLILDNFESLMQSGSRSGQYQREHEGYGKFLKHIGEIKHQSCLLLTSREKPAEVPRLEGRLWPVRSMHLSGIEPHDGKKLLSEEGLLGSDEEWAKFISLYSGNPLALKLVSEPIRELFNGNIAAFLAQEEVIVGDISNLLDQQFNRLSALEQEIIYWLAIEREPTSLEDIRSDLVASVSSGELLEALSSLRRRSMVEMHDTAQFSLQPVIMEYATNKLVDQAYKELYNGDIGGMKLLTSHALLKAQAKDYVRESQARLILTPFQKSLLVAFTQEECEERLRKLLSALREKRPYVPGYLTGNILNLLILMKADLRNYDFSHLTIKQAYLQGISLRDVNFTDTDLERSVFTETFGSILSVTFSPDGNRLAAGTDNGEVRLWNIVDGTPLHTCEGHTDWVRSVAFSPKGDIVVSGSDDQTVRLWEVETGQTLTILQGHTNRIYSVVFSPDGQLIASGGEDQSVLLWSFEACQCLKKLEGHTNRVRSVAFSSDSKLVVSGSDDQTVRLWDAASGKPLGILQGHTNRVYSVAFSPDGRLIASGGEDQKICLWDVSTHTLLKTFTGHTNRVRSVAFSLDGETLVSGSEDHLARLWNIHTGQCIRTFQGHTNGIWSVAFKPYGNRIVSGSDDQTIRLWDVITGQCIKTLQGYTDLMWSVAFSPDGNMIVSGSEDQMVRLWDVAQGQCIKELPGHTNRVWSVAFSSDKTMIASGSDDQTVRLWNINDDHSRLILRGHTNWVTSVAFSPDGQTVASGSEDQTIRLWDVSTGQCRKTLRGHNDWVRSVAFSPDGQIVASGSEDQTIRLWNVTTGQTIQTLSGHTNRLRTVVFSPDGTLLASGSDDRTIRLWNVAKGQCIDTLHGHEHWILSVCFSPDGTLLASGSDDRTIRLWDVAKGQCIDTLYGHTHRVYSVVFNPSGTFLASGSHDGTIRFWDVTTGECLKSLKNDRPYERLNITQAHGLTTAQRSMLRALGAIER